MSAIRKRPDVPAQFELLPACVTQGGLLIGGVSIVESWELPVQQVAAQLAARESPILEIGYGLGMAAARIQELGAGEHWIVEAHPTVAENARQRLLPRQGVRLLAKRWEDTLVDLPSEYFGSVFFDSYPFSAIPFNGSALATIESVSAFAEQIIGKLTNSGTLIFIDFSRQAHCLTAFGRVQDLFDEIQVLSVQVVIPTRCTYASGGTANVISLRTPKRVERITSC